MASLWSNFGRWIFITLFVILFIQTLNVSSGTQKGWFNTKIFGSSICNIEWNLSMTQYYYRQISNIRFTIVGNTVIDHSDVVGASPVGAAPTTSSLWTKHLASMDRAQITARLDENHLRFGASYIREFTGITQWQWQKQDTDKTKDISYLALTDKLWRVFGQSEKLTATPGSCNDV